MRIILYEEKGRPWPNGLRFEVFRALLDKGYNASYTFELADEGSAPLLVLGMFPNGAPPGAAHERRTVFTDVHNLDARDIVQRVDQAAKARGAKAPGGWNAWFPVIDYDRCTHCMECLNFCLFDVYAVSEKGEIEIRNHEKCKTDCPACSRVCPEAAIIFPKYSAAPMNGAEIDEAAPEKIKVDVSKLLGGNIYQTLRERSTNARRRFSTEQDEQRALEERQRHLQELKKQLDIPDHLLGALPPDFGG